VQRAAGGVAPYDQTELGRLRALGIDSPEDDPTVLLEAAPGTTPRYWFQRVPEAKTTKNRVHLDLRCHDVEAETERLVALGGRLLAEHPSHVVLADPEGNELCLLRGPDA
jgi:hypothetical protein